MKHILGTQIYSMTKLQTIVIEKLRILGFEKVSEDSITLDDIHRELFISAIETNISNIEVLLEEQIKVLKRLKKQK